MELTSPTFFLALAVLFFLHWSLPRRWRNPLLLTGSYVLYAIWDLRFLAVLVGATLLDYLLALKIDRERSGSRRKIFLAVSVTANLSILGFFKYANFFLSSLHELGLPFGTATLNVFVPLGVSFYTFHSISYVVDVYRRKIPATRSLSYYALYVSFFPKLICGPIERLETFQGELRESRTLALGDLFVATRWLLLGLFLKLAVGDRLALLTDAAYADRASSAAPPLLWLGFYAYALQIYADFLGYTLIARGASLFFGIRLSENFRSPYFSSTPREFWHRWHISLSTWFRDYLYVPLGGSRRLVYRNIMLTMLLAGLWHGANAKFLVWGFYHGVLVCIQRALRTPTVLTGWARGGGVVLTFHLVAVGWIFFRADSFPVARTFLWRMIGGGGTGGGVEPAEPFWIWFGLLLGAWALVLGLQRVSAAMENPRYPWRSLPAQGLLFGLMAFVVALLGVSDAKPFIYFYF